MVKIKPDLHNLSLLQRIVLLGALLSVGLILVVGYVIQQSADSLRDHIKAERLATTEMAAHTLDESLREITNEFLAGTDLLRLTSELALPDRMPDAINHILYGSRREFFRDGILILDASGTVVASDSSSFDGEQLDYLEGQIAESLGSVRLSDYYFSPGFLAPTSPPQVSRVIVALIAPTIDSGGTLLGYMVGLIDPASPSFLESMTKGSPSGSTGHFDLLDSRAKVIASNEGTDILLSSGDHPEFYITAARTGSALIETVEHLERDEQELGLSPPENEDHVMAYVPLRQAPWALAIGASEDETFAPVVGLQRRATIVTGLVLALALIGGVVGVGKLVRPIRILSNAARRMADGNLAHTVVIKEGGEIADLADAMDTMRIRLGSSLHEIQTLNQSLEVRIAERTQEVEQQNRELVATSAIAETMTSFVHLQELLDHAISTVATVIDQETLAIFLVDRDSRQLRLEAGIGLPESLRVADAQLSLGECLCGQVAVSGETEIVGDVRDNLTLATSRCGQAGFYCIASLPLRSREGVEGVLTILSRTPDSLHKSQFRSVMMICRQIGIAIHNARLYAELEEKEQLARTVAAKVIDAQEEERKRLARELHDETGQALIGIGLSLESVEKSLPSPMRDTRHQIEVLKEMSETTLAGLRNMVLALRPSALDDLGLVPTVRRYALQNLEPLGIEVNIVATQMTRDHLDAAVETLLFRVTQEAINNVARHSQATNVTISLASDEKSITGFVEDDGIGFDADSLFHRSGSSLKGLGLQGMKERVGLTGGEITIESKHGQGTRITLRVPYVQNERGPDDG